MSQKQTIDAAMRTARATGGKVHKGAIHSTVAGRTDHLPMHVASGSYVIPADIISAMGEGNSMAGFKVAKNIFSRENPDITQGKPYGGANDITQGTPYGESGLPYDASTPKKSGGGGADSGQAAARSPVATAVRPAVVSANRATTTAPVAASSNNSATARSRAAVATQPSQSDRYTGLWDMVNGGGKGGGYKNLGDMFNGGGMGASQSSRPYSASPVSSSGGNRNTLFNKAKPLLGMLVGGPMGYALGKGFQTNADGETGFGKFLNNENYADGGATDGVPIVAAGGEYVIPPEDVVHIGGGDMDHGHKVLDAFVKKMRQKTIKTLQGLPGPKKD